MLLCPKSVFSSVRRSYRGLIKSDVRVAKYMVHGVSNEYLECCRWMWPNCKNIHISFKSLAKGPCVASTSLEVIRPARLECVPHIVSRKDIEYIHCRGTQRQSSDASDISYAHIVYDNIHRRPFSLLSLGVYICSCTWLMQMKNLDSGEPEDVRILLRDAVAEHGL